MKASSVRADAGARKPSAKKAEKLDGQTRPRIQRQASPMMSPALRAGCTGCGMGGMAGELASMSPIQRQSAVQALQRTRGNGFVQRLAIQAKLKVGPAGDRYERQADHVADQVMRMTEPANPVQRHEDAIQAEPLASSITPLVQRVSSFITPLVQRQGEEEEIQTKPLIQRQGEEEEIQTKSATAAGGFEAGSAFESRLSAARGGGRPLTDGVRGQMEAGFGADFSGVRIHTGSESAELNRAVSAQAFTHGKDIYLGADRYDPGTMPDKRLLAHELTHVVQQTGTGSVRRQSNAAQAKPSGVLQRVLAFKPGDLEGELTFKAKAAGFFGKKSTWAQIQQTLKAYWADPKHPIALLMKLDNLADQWLARHGSSTEPNDQLKKQSLTNLKAQIQVEYGSISGPKAPTAVTTPPAGGMTKPAKPPVPTMPLPPIPIKHVVPAKPLPPIPTKPTATTGPADPVAKAMADLAPVGIAPQLLSQFPQSDLQLLADAHRALTNRDTAAADAALVALKASADPTVQAVFGLVKTYLMRFHIGALAPEVQQIFDPNFKLDPAASLDQVALQTAKNYLENPTTVSNAAGMTGKYDLGQAAQIAKATLAEYSALDPVEVLAIEAYTSELYKEINGVLRRALTAVSGMTPEQIAWAKAAVSGLHKLKPATVSPVFRHDGVFKGFLETHQQGAVVTDFAFKSSAQEQEGCSKGGAGHDVLSVIQQRSGLDVRGTAFFGAGEAEVLFPPGVQFRVDERADKVAGNPSNPDWTPASAESEAKKYWQKETIYKGSIDHILFMSEK